MKLPTKLVAVKKITSNVDGSLFSSEDIDRVASLIIDVEGTINPIILRRTSLESYEVVNGHFEYYAAVRAREISLEKGEMIQAIILEPENEKALLEQITFFRDSPETDSLKLQLNQLREENKTLKSQTPVVNPQVSTCPFNNQLLREQINQDIVSQITQSFIQRLESTIDVELRLLKEDIQEIKEKVIPPLLNLNTAIKSQLIEVPGLGPKKADDILNRIKAKGKFQSVDELIEIRGISMNTIKNNKWHDYLTVKVHDEN